MKKSPSWTPTYKIPRFVSCIRLLGYPAADARYHCGRYRGVRAALRRFQAVCAALSNAFNPGRLRSVAARSRT